MMNTILSQKRQVITPDMRQGIARAFRNGKSFDEIKVMFSVSGTSIRRILDENKIPYTKKRRFWTEDEKKKIERYVTLGWDIPTIAKQLGRNEGSVGAYIRFLGGLKDLSLDGSVIILGTPRISAPRDIVSMVLPCLRIKRRKRL